MKEFQPDVRVRRLSVFLLLLAIVVLVLGGTGTVGAQRPDGDEPLLREGAASSEPDPQKDEASLADEAAMEAPLLDAGPRGQIIDGQYIVVFKEGTTNPQRLAATLARAHGAGVLQSYQHAIKGFAAQLSPQAVRALQAHPDVAYIEPDQIITIVDTQPNATWGLDRIGQRDLPLNGSYTYNSTSSGVNAYIIDTGIRLTHNDFGGRAVSGYDAIDGGSADDCNGHGTHVAGTVGGGTWGVAKAVRLVAVRVLNCQGSGTNSQVIAGIDWVTANHQDPAVANMSLGGSASTALDNAVTNSINAGITYAVAAGNDNRNACNYSPARVGAAITVGSTTSSDARSSFSNYGNCLDIFAPGSSITSAWHTSNTATNTISGPSMASPHTAGVAALYLQGNPGASPATVRNALVNGASANRLSSIGSGSPNLLLYSLLTGGDPQPTPTPTPPPPGGNVIQNPGFESGRVAWTEYSSGGYPLITTDRPRTGSWSAWNGGYNNAIDQLHQRVTVPSNGTLRYYWRMETQESGTRVYDWMEVRLYDGNTGDFITTLRRWTNASSKNVWSQDSISLSSYAGRYVYVLFHTDTDSSYATSFFVDDVSLQ